MTTHRYQVSLDWTGDRGSGTSAYEAYDRDYIIRVAGKEAILGSSDPAFRGNASLHNPEDLFVASIASCHMLWYLHLCATRRVIVTGYADEASATMEEGGTVGGSFTEVILHPRVTLAPGSDTELAIALHHDAHRACFLANSVRFPIHLEPVVEISKA